MGFPWVFQGFSRDFPGIFHGFSMGFPWVFHGFPWVFHGFSRIYDVLACLSCGVFSIFSPRILGRGLVSVLPTRFPFIFEVSQGGRSQIAGFSSKNDKTIRQSLGEIFLSINFHGFLNRAPPLLPNPPTTTRNAAEEHGPFGPDTVRETQLHAAVP